MIQLRSLATPALAAKALRMEAACAAVWTFVALGLAPLPLGPEGHVGAGHRLPVLVRTRARTGPASVAAGKTHLMSSLATLALQGVIVVAVDFLAGPHRFGSQRRFEVRRLVAAVMAAIDSAAAAASAALQGSGRCRRRPRCRRGQLHRHTPGTGPTSIPARKTYLMSPAAMLSFQGVIERPPVVAMDFHVGPRRFG